MYTKFTFDVEKKSAATYLWNIIRKYNVDVNENYHEESVKLQQCCRRWRTTTWPAVTSRLWE